MAQDLPGIFASREAFESYCERLTSSLDERRTSRIEFLQQGVERLRSLEHTATVVGDTETAADLTAHITAAEAQLTTLRQLSL